MKPINIMKSLDLFLIAQVDKLTESQSYQKIADQFSSTEENVQLIVRYILMSLTIILPLLLALFLFIFTSSLNSDLKIKEEVIHTASQIISQTQDIQTVSRKVFGSPLETQSQLQNVISTTLANGGIDASKVLISNFSNMNQDSVVEVSADLKFNSFSSENFYTFINNLILKSKIKITQIEVKKNKATNLIDGILSISYYSKPVQED